MQIKKLHVVADGEANFYTLGDERTWFCRAQMNGEMMPSLQVELLQKMAAAVTSPPMAPMADEETVAYIAFGFRGALAEGLVFDPDEFSGEVGLMSELISHAPALDAELQRGMAIKGSIRMVSPSCSRTRSPSPSGRISPRCWWRTAAEMLRP